MQPPNTTPLGVGADTDANAGTLEDPSPLTLAADYRIMAALLQNSAEFRYAAAGIPRSSFRTTDYARSVERDRRASA